MATDLLHAMGAITITGRSPLSVGKNLSRRTRHPTSARLVPNDKLDVSWKLYR